MEQLVALLIVLELFLAMDEVEELSLLLILEKCCEEMELRILLKFEMMEIF